MQQERFKYEKYVLKNGITVFYLPMDVQIGQAIISIPFGSKHNVGEIPLGGFHFLEHCVLNRSKKFPELDSFAEFIGKGGGYKNGTTTRNETFYEVEVPSSIFMQAFEGILSHIYEPIFTQADVDGEKSIIINEFTKKAPFFPGNTEASQYLFTEFMNNMPLSLEKRLGDDKSLQSMNVAMVENLHKYYFTNKVSVFIGGVVPIDECLKLLEKIPTVEIDLPSNYEPLSFVHAKYHEKEFKETHRCEYHFLYLLKNITTYEEFKSHQILLEVLVNTSTGKLRKWLRNELGVYDVTTLKFTTEDRIITGFKIPLSSIDKVESVRKIIDARITEALQDDVQIKEYIESVRLGNVFSFQTINSRLSFLFDECVDHGHPITDKIMNEVLNKIEQPGYLLNLYNKIKEEGEFGEVLIKPISDN